MFGRGGWGYGHRHGWGGWGGYGRRWWPPASVEGYTYVGPCRCGWGPHAYYVDSSGRLVHAWDVFSGRAPVSFQEAELEALKREKEELEKRIRELEEKLKKGGES